MPVVPEKPVSHARRAACRARRIAAPVAAAVLGAGLLSGCGSGQDATVTMWTYPIIYDEAANQAYWSDLVERFEAEHPGVSVRVETYPWSNRDASLATAIGAGKGPDVVYLLPDQLPKYAGSIEPLDPHLPDGARADYTDLALEAVSYEGQVLGAPILTSANPLVCDRRAFEAIGADAYPETWADLAELGPRLAEEGYYATSYSGDTQQTLNLTFYPLLWQAGGEVFAEDGESVAFHDEAGVRALTFLAELVDAGYTDRDLVTTTPELEQTPVARGEVACTWQNTPMDVAAFWGPENTVVLPPLGDAERVGYGTVGALSMLEGADTEVASDWINFVAETENITELQRLSGNFPARASGGELYPDDELMSAVGDSLELMDPGPLHDRAREVMGVLAPQIQDALLGGASPREALDRAAEAAQVQLDR